MEIGQQTRNYAAETYPQAHAGPVSQSVREHLNDTSARLANLRDLVSELEDKISGPQPRDATGSTKGNNAMVDPPYSGLVNHAGSISHATGELRERLASLLTHI